MVRVYVDTHTQFNRINKLICTLTPDFSFHEYGKSIKLLFRTLNEFSQIYGAHTFLQWLPLLYI